MQLSTCLAAQLVQNPEAHEDRLHAFLCGRSTPPTTDSHISPSSCWNPIEEHQWMVAACMEHAKACSFPGSGRSLLDGHTYTTAYNHR